MPTRTGYAFVGWRGRNLINIYKGYANDNGHVTYTIGQNDTITVENDANADSGTSRYDCALIPIEDLTEGKYRLSAENLSYIGGDYPIVYVAGVIDGGAYSTDIAFNYYQSSD